MLRPIVIVGQLASMTRAEAARIIALTGGKLTDRVTRDTALIIVGSRGPQLQRSGRPLRQLAQANRLSQEGLPLQILREQEWLRSIGLASDAAGICNRITATQLAEMLHVPRSKLERWIAAGLVRPAEINTGIPLFEFQQVAAVRTLVELLQSGVPLAKIRRAVASLATWLSSANEPLLELSLDDGIQRLVVRTEEGRLAEPSGQLLLEFDPGESTASVAFAASETEADAFRRAVECEETRPLEAAAIYRDLIAQRGPHPMLAFNLGNALCAAEDLAGAVEQYRRATQLDPQHAGAWNNLANLLAELDRPDDAIDAYRRALTIDPQLGDARFNLAQILVEVGRADESLLHWQAYLAADSDSVWAEYAKERLSAR